MLTPSGSNIHGILVFLPLDTNRPKTRWKQERKLTAAPVFITVHNADASAPSNSAPSDEGAAP